MNLHLFTSWGVQGGFALLAIRPGHANHPPVAGSRNPGRPGGSRTAPTKTAMTSIWSRTFVFSSGWSRRSSVIMPIHGGCAMRSFEAGGSIRFGSLIVPPDRVVRGTTNGTSARPTTGTGSKTGTTIGVFELPARSSARTGSTTVLPGVQRSVQGRS